MNNEDKNSYSQNIQMMKQYLKQKLEIKQESIDIKKKQEDNKVFQEKQKYNNFQSNQNYYFDDGHNKDKLEINDINANELKYQTLKDQIKEVQIQLDNRLVNKSTNMLDQILLSSRINMQKEQQKDLYVEVLMLTNKYAKYYLQHQADFKNAYILLQKCESWNQTYDIEPCMRVLTNINQGYYFSKLRRNAQSLDMFNEALKLSLEKKYYLKLSEIYFNLAQLNYLIGQHEKTQDYASKALQQCSMDVSSANSTDIRLNRILQQEPQFTNDSKQFKQENNLQKYQYLYSKYSSSEYSNKQNNNYKRQTTNDYLLTEQNEYQLNQLNEEPYNQCMSSQSSIEQNEYISNIQNKYSFSVQNESIEKPENEFLQSQLNEFTQSQQIQKGRGDILKQIRGNLVNGDKVEWCDNQIINLINCYQILAKAEEYLLHFDEANCLLTQAVSIAKHSLGSGSQISEILQNKLMAFQQRQQEYKQNKFQNKQNNFSHHIIKPLLQKYLNEKSINFNSNTIQQIQDVKMDEYNVQTLQRKESQNNLQNSINIITCNSHTPRQMSQSKFGNSQVSNNNKVTVIRQKKLNLEILPSSLKFNASNCTVPTQNSIVSSSTATTKNVQNSQKDQPSFYKIKNHERKSSFCEENTQKKESNFRNTQFTPIKQSDKWCKTQRDEYSPKNIFQRDSLKRSSSTSFQNDAFSAYPPPRIRSKKDLYIPQKQRNTEPDSLNLQNSDNLNTLMENQISIQQPLSKTQTQKQTIYEINFNKNSQKQPVLAQSYLQTTKSSLINSKSHLQTFVNQMNLQRSQLSLQFQEMEAQLLSNSQQYSQSQHSPLAQIFEDSFGQQKTNKTPRKIQIYSNIKRNKKDTAVAQSIHSNRKQSSMSHIRQKAMSQYDQPQYLNADQNLVSVNQQLQIEQNLQNQNQLGEVDTLNSKDPYFTLIPKSHILNNNNTEKQKFDELQKKKSLSNHIRYHTEGSSYQSYIERTNELGQELLYEVKQSYIKISDSDKDNQNDSQLASNQQQKQINLITNVNLQLQQQVLGNAKGNTKFLLNKQSMMIIIEFTQNKNGQQQDKDFSNQYYQNFGVLNHSVNISDIYTFYSPKNLNNSIILSQVCSKIYNYLEIDIKNKQLIIKSNNQSIQNQKYEQPGIHFVIEVPNIIKSTKDSIAFQLVKKDHKTSIIHCKEKLQTQIEDKLNKYQIVKSQSIQGIVNQLQINSPITLHKAPNISQSTKEDQYLSSTPSQSSQLNKQVVFSYISKVNLKDQNNILGKQTDQIKQNQIKLQKDNELQNIKYNYDQNLLQNSQSQILQQKSQQLQQQLQLQQLLQFQRSLYSKSNYNTDDNQGQFFDLDINKKSSISKYDSLMKLQIKPLTQSPMIHKTTKDNNLNKQNSKQ